MAEPHPGRRATALRPARFDDLGLRRALSDRLLPSLVAAMAFLAALALAGVVAAASLARHWQEGAAAALTVQVPSPGAAAAPPSPTSGPVTSGPAISGAATSGTASPQNRRDAVLAILRGTAGITSVRALTDGELNDLLQPWLGQDAEKLALPLPAVIRVSMASSEPDLGALGARLAAAAPGTLVESHGVWVARLSALARSLQACAGVCLLVVAAVAVSTVAVATRAGLMARREAIEIVHGLGATDGYIAGRFAGRATLLATTGGVIGALAALPVLLGLAGLAAPFAAGPQLAGGPDTLARWLGVLPDTLWLALPVLPAAAAAIGWLTAQGTVRRWLRRLP